LSTYDCKTANEPALVITTCRSTALIVKIYTHTSPCQALSGLATV